MAAWWSLTATVGTDWVSTRAAAGGVIRDGVRASGACPVSVSVALLGVTLCGVAMVGAEPDRFRVAAAG